MIDEGFFHRYCFNEQHLHFLRMRLSMQKLTEHVSAFKQSSEKLRGCGFTCGRPSEKLWGDIFTRVEGRPKNFGFMFTRIEGQSEKIRETFGKKF